MKNTVKAYFSLGNMTMFVSLFLLLAMHSPKDLFTPYLWAEDGKVLISGAIYNGIKSIFIPGNGAYWVIPKLLAWLCYIVTLPFNNITVLPYLMQVLTKSLATLSILYFVCEKFDWVLKEKWQRFFVCVVVVLLFPQGASDVVTCDTSLPFYFVFPLFLIGLDLLCSPKASLPSLWQTFFMILFALSSAAAPFVLLITVAAVIRVLVMNRKTLFSLSKRSLIIAATKIIFICIAVWIQLSTVLSSGRANSNFELYRIVANTKYFIFVPYLMSLPLSIKIMWFIGLFSWIIAWRVSKVPFIVLLYGGAFSWGYMLLSSMTNTVNVFYPSILTGAPRYSFVCYEIAAFIMSLAVLKLIKKKCVLRYVAFISIFMIAIVAIRRYDIPVIGPDFAVAYRQNAALFDRKGKERVLIPIGPWSPWEMSIPASILVKDCIEDIDFFVETTNGAFVGTDNYGKLDFRTSNFANLSGWARTGAENQVFSKLLLRSPVSGDYRTAAVLNVREDFHGEPIKHNGFAFTLPKDYFGNGLSALEAYGQTTDGAWHHGVWTFATEIQ